MVVIKGRRSDGTVDDAEGYDTGEESDEEEGQEVPLDGTKVRDYILLHDFAWSFTISNLLSNVR